MPVLGIIDSCIVLRNASIIGNFLTAHRREIIW